MSAQEASEPRSAVDASFVGRRRPGVASLEIDGESVVYDETTETTHLLNPTGSLAWSLFDGQSRLNELAEELAEAYGTSPGVVLPDLLALARELCALGLLERAEGEPSSKEAGLSG
ncbi:MAG: PqqD family protein [Acidimicrobiales bacterium]